jgi:outer membrane receptor protein involved in Fe transport
MALNNKLGLLDPRGIIMNSKFLIVALVSALALFAADIQAQEGLVLEEITVTAQKREQSLKDVPISVSAISGDYIANGSIDSLNDLAGSIPNISITESQIDTRITVRGIRTGSNKGFEQSVAMYMDGIYFGRSQLYRLPLVDLERVEVLRGPQPTLFGKNAIAGAVSVNTARPTDEFEGSISVSHEFEHEESQIVGIISGPMTENLSGRLVASYRDMDGYFTNTTLNRKEPNREQTYLRGLLNWDNDDNVRLLFKAEWSDFDTEGRQLENNTPIGDFEAIYPLIFGIPVDTVEDYGNEGVSANSLNEVTNVSLNVDFDIGDLTLTSVTGYIDYDTTEFIDVDYTAVELLDGTNQAESYSQFSQEFRFTSPAGEKIDYIFGAYFQSNDLTATDVVPFGPALLGTPFAPLVDSWTDRLYKQDGTLWSVFAQADFNLTDRLTITAGGRYNDEEKSGSRELQIVAGPTNTGVGIPSPVPVFPNLLELLYSTFNIVPHLGEGDRDETSFNPLVNVQYQFSDGIMGYVSYTEGTKAGGFDIRGNSLPGDPRVATPGTFEFEDESATSIELGAKMRWDRFDLNFAYFDTNYEDRQTSIFDGVLGFLVLNASEATVSGFEADWRALISQDLQFYGAIGYLDFEYDNFEEGKCAFGVPPDNGMGGCSLTGKRAEATPEWTGSFGFDYEKEVSSSLVFDANLNGEFSSDYHLMAELDEKQVQDSFQKWGLQLGLGDVEGKWRVSVIGDNLTDERIRLTSGNLPLAATFLGVAGFSGNAYDSFYDRPRNVTLKVDYRF